MNKKRLLGLILSANIVVGGMFLTTELLINDSQTQLTKEENIDITAGAVKIDKKNNETTVNSGSAKVEPTVEPTKAAGVSNNIEEATAGFAADTSGGSDSTTTDWSMNQSFTQPTEAVELPKLITNSREVDYQSYIPRMKIDSDLEMILNINNPKINIDAKAAILFDANTKQILYYKNPVKAVFPASTLKLLSTIVALHWCNLDEEVTIGDEIKMIASDSTRAYLKKGEVIKVKSLLEGMLLPSGNDAAYAVAAYVGRKSLNNPQASKEDAVTEFVRLMNAQAKELGVKNSCFKTPDGYDAIGQYTTAYDMGLIGMAAADNPTILEIAGKSSASTTFVSGEGVTWYNTNKLIKRFSGEYYPKAIGLKTGTSTMAGRCLIAAAQSGGRKVVCVILDSTSVGRWEDAIDLLKYGLK